MCGVYMPVLFSKSQGFNQGVWGAKPDSTEFSTSVSVEKKICFFGTSTARGVITGLYFAY